MKGSFVKTIIIFLSTLSMYSCNNLYHDVLSAKRIFIPKQTTYYIYTTNHDSNNISGYNMDSNSGELTEIQGSPWDTGTAPWNMTADPAGKFLYVAHLEALTVSGYSIDSSGALTEITGSPWSTLVLGPVSVTVDPTGKFVYVALPNNNKVSGYSINTNNGALTEISGSPWGSMQFPWSVTTDPTGRFVYAANNNTNNVSGYSIGTNGALTEISGSPWNTGESPVSVVVHPTGKFVYVDNVDPFLGSISGYSIGTNGALTEISGSPWPATSGTTGPDFLVLEPTGRFAYITHGNGFVYKYNIDSTTGELTTHEEFNTGIAGPKSVTVDPTGKFLYITNWTSKNISGFRINSTTGALTQINGSPWNTGTYPRSVITIHH